MDASPIPVSMRNDSALAKALVLVSFAMVSQVELNGYPVSSEHAHWMALDPKELQKFLDELGASRASRRNVSTILFKPSATALALLKRLRSQFQH